MVGVVRKYINNRIELLKLEFTETTSNLVSILIYIFIVLIVAMMFLFIFSFSIGMLIGKWLNNFGLGLLIFSSVYLIFFIALLLNYQRIRKYIMRKIIEFQLNNKENEEEDDQD